MRGRVPRGCRIYAMLRAQGRHLSFHTPGHKRRGEDITELSYSDNLLSPTGVLAAAEKEIAALLGAEKSFLLTDGSTCGVFAMLYAAKRLGAAKIAVSAYCHRSVLNACGVMGLTPVFMEQPVRCGIPAQPAVCEMARALAQADALLLTSPDYYGYFPDLAAARSLCVGAGKLLLIDGAHGAHLKGTSRYAGNFADLWVDGVHKSLPALTQGAVVSAKEGAAEALADGVRIFRTSSPSYPVMASVEYAVRYPRNRAVERAAEALKREAGALENEDWSKIVVPFGEKSGAAQQALERRRIYCEFNDGNYLMFYLSPATTLRALKKLASALRGLPRGHVRDEAHTAGMGGGNVVLCPLKEAAGKVCACDCGIFPPCMPVVRRGETIGSDAVRRLSEAKNTFGLTDGKIKVYTE